MGDDPNSLNIIGSYDGNNRSVREHGDNFSWNTVDQGWIRAQNNAEIVARAPLNEDGTKRQVQTPWFSDMIPFEEAAQIGTKKVITEHSTIGLVITCDGSISDIPRIEYEEAEENNKDNNEFIDVRGIQSKYNSPNCFIDESEFEYDWDYNTDIELNLDEASMLAGIPQSPKYNSPLVNFNKK